MSEEKTELSPDQLLFSTLYAPPSYDEMDPTKVGTYKFVWDGEDPVAVAWSDEKNALGIYSKDSNNLVVSNLRKFVTDMAEVKFPAIHTFDLLDSKAIITDQRRGLLEEVLGAADSFFSDGTIPEMKDDDEDD